MRPVGFDCLVRFIAVGCVERANVDILKLGFSLQVAARSELPYGGELASLLLDGCVFGLELLTFVDRDAEVILRARCELSSLRCPSILIPGKVLRHWCALSLHRRLRILLIVLCCLDSGRIRRHRPCDLGVKVARACGATFERIVRSYLLKELHDFVQVVYKVLSLHSQKPVIRALIRQLLAVLAMLLRQACLVPQFGEYLARHKTSCQLDCLVKSESNPTHLLDRLVDFDALLFYLLPLVD